MRGDTSEPISPRKRHLRRGGAPSPLDALLALLALVEGVLDLGHLGGDVGDLEERRVRVAAGDDDVLVAGAVVRVSTTSSMSSQPPLEQVGELVEDIEVWVSSARRRLISAQPSRAASAWSSSVPALRDHDQPEPILCHSMGPPWPVGGARRPRRQDRLLADAPLGRLDELEHPDRPALVPAAQGQPEGRRRLPLAGAAVDDDERAVAALWRW
jgi:hypothetical protein